MSIKSLCCEQGTLLLNRFEAVFAQYQASLGRLESMTPADRQKAIPDCEKLFEELNFALTVVDRHRLSHGILEFSAPSRASQEKAAW